MMPLIVGIMIPVVLFLSVSLKVAKEHERTVIFRLGHFIGIKGPGLVLIIPVVDRFVKINLSEGIPGWQALSKEELIEKIKKLATQ